MLLASASIFVGASVVAYAEGSVVHINLSDHGDAPMAIDLGMGNSNADMNMATFKIAPDTQSVKAGLVTFEVTNTSTSIIHEMVVGKVDPNSLPPYDAANAKVDEESFEALGEVAELDPGKSGSVTLNLEPGSYVLFCNIPGHYMGGMWSVITAE
jgi:uncharacterized cupredoxin-like copper-binding protein